MEFKNERIRVLVVVPSMITGGSETVALSIVKYLDPARFDAAMVSLFAPQGLSLEERAEMEGVPVHYLHKGSGLDPSIFFQLHRLFRKVRPHVVQNHLYALYTLLPAMAWNRIPVRVHRMSSIASKEADSPIRRRIFQIAFGPLGVQPVSISEEVRQTVRQEFGHVGSPIIYTGIDTERFHPDPDGREEWRQAHRIPPRAPLIAHAGRFVPLKNHLLLLDAFAEVVKQYPESRLVLIGEGELFETVRERVTKLGLADRVLMPGVMKDIAPVLKAADLYVLPSQWEGISVSVLEAMAAGLPVVASAVGGMAEAISEGRNGYLIPPNSLGSLVSAICKLVAEPELRTQLGHESRSIALSRFDVRQMAQRYGDLYLELLEKKRQGTV